MRKELCLVLIAGIYSIGCGSGEEFSYSETLSTQCEKSEIDSCYCSPDMEGVPYCYNGSFTTCKCDNKIDAGEIDAEKSDVTSQDGLVIDQITPEANAEDSANINSDSGQCSPGESICSGKNSLFCDVNGKWTNPYNCEFLCIKGVCQGECEPGSKKCVESMINVCDDSGKWKVTQKCDAGCNASNNACNEIKWCCHKASITDCNCYYFAGKCSAENKTCEDLEVEFDCCRVDSRKPNECRCGSLSTFSFPTPVKTCEEWLQMLVKTIDEGNDQYYSLVKNCPNL